MLAQITTEVEPFVAIETWLLLLGLVTPFVTAVLTKVHTSDSVKGMVSGVVTALVAFIVTALKSGDLTVEMWFNGWVQILASHAVSWLMFLSTPVAAVNRSTPGVIGGSNPIGPIENQPMH